MIRLLSFLLILVSSTANAAESLSFSSNSRTFDTQHQSLLVKALAFSCLALREIPDSIPCNPAMTPYATKGSLKIEGLISNGTSNLYRMQRLLDGNIDDALITDLFSNDRVLQVEAQADMMFVSKFLNARYSPVSYKYFSVIRNDANPEVELSAVSEQGLTFQSGYSYGPFDFGIELRKVDWEFIKQRFYLLALATPAGQEAIKAKKQTAYFINPGIVYNAPLPWSPRVAVKVENLGTIDEKYDEFDHPVDTQVGLSLSPPIPFGYLDLLLDYKRLEVGDNQGQVHFGTLFRYGVSNLALGADEYGLSAGIYYGLEQINAGILYSTTQTPWKENKDNYAQTVYVQVGWQL